MNTNALWFTVVLLGLYHGLNPAMGWPLAVAKGMTDRRAASVFATMLPLGGGHAMAIAVALAPFAWLGWYLEWGRAIRVGAGLAVLSFGIHRLVKRRHPRLLLRIAPTRLAWWSFLMATAHGAGLMLVPFMLGLCAAPAPGQRSVMASMAQANAGTAMLIVIVHTVATLCAGIGMAWIVYRYLGLRFLQRAWLDLDMVWGASLVVAGAAAIGLGLGLGL